GPGASAPASPTPGSKTCGNNSLGARCCARWRPASPIGRSATAEQSAAASPMQTRPRIGPWRSRRSERRSISGMPVVRAPCHSKNSCWALSLQRCARTRSSSPSRCPSCRARDVTAITNSVARPANMPRRARRRCLIQDCKLPASISARFEPRLHLGDFLREHCRLTGTHLGCEHGVCGACTVLIAGAPARSCITYAVACEGLAIETIEGFDDDPIMAELREAFSREHGLQCGFCTPGMLIAARDIVQRLPGADESRIRVELSGNLCRCTGYRGIVNAVRSVVESRRA